MLGVDEYREIADRCGMNYRGRSVIDEDDLLYGGEAADALFFLDNLSRITGRSLQSVWDDRMSTHYEGELVQCDLEDAARTTRLFKAQTGLRDHTDVLEDFLKFAEPPELDALIVDEAQDLSRLQWMCIDKIATNVKEVIVAFDEDQSIHRWAGADLDHVLNLQGSIHVLDQSHRIPASVHRLARGIVEKIGRRREKLFRPREAEGLVETLYDIDEIDASKGRWFLLGRHGYQLRQLQEICKREGWFYRWNKFQSNDTPEARAIMNWETWRSAGYLRSLDAANMLRLAGEHALAATAAAHSPERSLDRSFLGDRQFRLQEPWHRVLRMDPEATEYFSAARRHGERMANRKGNQLEAAEPRIRISTIHGTKGDQEENVLLMTDVSQSTYNAMQRNADDEHRVFYVGATRAMERLCVLAPQTNLAYEI